MFLPAEYATFEPVLIGAAVVFVVGLLGNILSFSSRFGNALVTAILFALIFGGLAYLSRGEAHPLPAHFLPAEYAWAELVLIGAGIVFVVDLIGNVLSFSNRFVNAIVSAIVFAVIFGGLTYLAYREGVPVPTVNDIAPAPTTAPAQ
jgi:ABC-type enterochelin transport system permease subunit